jgi:uncharacterized RDD family membrane protein YckC
MSEVNADCSSAQNGDNEQEQQQTKKQPGGVWGHAMGAIVSPIIECTDVDGIMRKVDVNALVDRIDFNRVLDKIDWDRQLQRIDVESLVLRSNLGAIVTESTTGIFTQLLDSLRVWVVVVDLLFLKYSRSCLCRRHASLLPQRPGADYEENHLRVPSKPIDKAIAVQGRFSGLFAKAIAILIDVSFVTLSFGMLLVVVELCRVIIENGGFFNNNHNSSASDGDDGTSTRRQVIDRNNLVVVILYCVYWFLYFFAGVLLTGQTLGMLIVGLKVVDSGKGKQIGPGQALLRTALLPLSVTLCPPLAFVGACRRDGRMLHDCIARTGVVYKWNARLTKIRERSLARYERSAAYTTYMSSSGGEEESSEHDGAAKSQRGPVFATVRTPIMTQSQYYQSDSWQDLSVNL